MRKLNLGLGTVSLIIGAVLFVVSIVGGVKPLGLIMGGLLAVNGVARLWLARRGATPADGPTKGQEHLLRRRDGP